MTELNTTFLADSDTAEYGEYEVCNMINAIMRSGITVDDDGKMAFGYTIGTGQITLEIGGMSLNDGMFYKPTTTPTITLPTPSANPRIDTIVARRTYADHVIDIVRIAGTEAASPTAPDYVRDGDYYDNALYSFKITTGGAVTLYKDYRTDVERCGAIRARDTSEMDAYIEAVETNIARLTELQAAAGGREIIISGDEPSSPSAGAIWFQVDDESRLTVKVYQASGIWQIYTMYVPADSISVGTKTADKILTDKIIGVRPNGDGAPQDGRDINPLPLEKAETGFYSATDYANLTNNKVKVLKAGIYQVTATIYISAGGQKAFKCTINKNEVTQAENLNTGNTEATAISATAVVHCNVGDYISLKLGCGGTTAYRYDASHTHLELYPLVLD